MTAIDTRPSRAQSDAEILAALDLPRTSLTHRLDRTDPYRIRVISTDHAGAEGIDGIAVLERTPDGYVWFLGCDGCEAELEPIDAGMCPSCRDFLAAQEG